MYGIIWKSYRRTTERRLPYGITQLPSYTGERDLPYPKSKGRYSRFTYAWTQDCKASLPGDYSTVGLVSGSTAAAVIPRHTHWQTVRHRAVSCLVCRHRLRQFIFVLCYSFQTHCSWQLIVGLSFIGTIQFIIVPSIYAGRRRTFTCEAAKLSQYSHPVA